MSLSEIFGTIDSVLGVLKDAKGQRSSVYLRFGLLPPGGESARGVYDPYGRELREGGLSVFRASPDGEGGYVVDCSTCTLEQCFRMFALEEERFAYLAEGAEVGVGRAGEPLLGGDVRLTPLPVGTRVRSSGAADGRGQTMSGKLLDSFPSGMVVGANGCRTLVSWDALVLVELVDG